jgi:hypothetical protein
MHSSLRLSICSATGACITTLASPSASLGFGVPYHRQITETALRRIQVQIAGQPVGFSDRAIEEICNANAATDDGFNQALWHPEWHFTNEAFQASSQGLVDSRTFIAMNVQLPVPQAFTARQLLGRATHTVQDFYAHSNWVELGASNIYPALGRALVLNPSAAFHPCPTAGDTLGGGSGGGLTSGYFGPAASLLHPSSYCGCNSIPAGKCYHGNYDALSCQPLCNDDGQNGINKDIPGRAGFTAAYELAIDSTEDYIRQIITDLGGDEDAIAALLDVRGSVGFVVDTTGSMSTSIAGVRSTIASLITSLNTDPREKPQNWVLVPFNDPGVGPAYVTEDATAMLGRVSTLSAYGGDDCPELSQGGLLLAVEQALPYSRLYLFTDASAKDASLSGLVRRRAQDKKIRVSTLATGSCSPIDPVYYLSAEETGGQVISLSPSQVASSAPLLLPGLSGDLQTILIQRVTLAGSRSLDIPVDASIRRMQVVVTRPVGVSVSLLDPAGSPVVSGTPGVIVQTLGDAAIYNVSAPALGTWRLLLSGTGAISVTAQGNSPLEFLDAAFVTDNSLRPEGLHGGYARTDGSPLAGVAGILEATLVGPATSASFTLVDDSGALIAPISLATDYPHAQPNHYLGALSVPIRPFRIVASGASAGGSSFRRQYPVLFRPQLLEVRAPDIIDARVPVGTMISLDFTVTNRGAPATFTFASADGLGFSGRPVPTGATLGNGESTAVHVDVNVPMNTPDGSNFTVTLTATNVTDRTVANSASVSLVATVGPRCSVICRSDFVVDLWPPNHAMAAVDLAQLGLADSMGRPVNIRIDSIVQDEPVNARGDGTTGADATGVGTAVALIRAERSGTGNGRVYRIAYTATCMEGGECQGIATVRVPRSQGGPAAIDDGTAFDSTQDLGSADIDADGVVTALDVAKVMELVGVRHQSQSQYFPKADVNLDGVVDALDAELASRRLGASR